jgi:hypothetical protein
LNTVGQIAATVYGGPGGSAAYAAWSTFKITGDANLAFRAGVISGATTWALQGVNVAPKDSALVIAKKAAVAGAIGGIAVAAAGRDHAQVKDGFLKGAAMVIVQAGYEKFTAKDFDPKGQIATRKGYCMTGTAEVCRPPSYVQVKDSKGNILYGDPTKFKSTDPVVNYVGLQTNGTDTGWRFRVSEKSPAMTAVGRVPPWNTMALAHDKLAITFHLEEAANVASIAPAIVVTYGGTAAWVYSDIQHAVIESAAKQTSLTPVSMTGPKPPPAVSTYVVANCMSATKPNVVTRVSVEFPPKATRSPYLCEVTKGCRRQKSIQKGKSPGRGMPSTTKYCADRALALSSQPIAQGWSCLAP